MNSELILALEDSKTLGYKHSARSESGDPGEPENSITKGFWTHSVKLPDAGTERTIGLIGQRHWLRDDDQRGKKHNRKQRPYEEKESFKWQQSSEKIERRLGEAMVRTISVCDREADVFEYTLYKLKHNQRFIVRATQNRTLLPDKPPPLIWLFQTIAKLRGWCDSRHTGRPGWLAVWKGWSKLQDYVEIWRMARQFRGVEM